MATIFTHALVPIAIAAGMTNNSFSKHLLWIAVLATLLPDADVIAFKLGISYSDPFGHRGFTHSLLFAVFAGLLVAAFASHLNTTKVSSFWLVFVSTASHPALDAMTNGGLGVALFWPLTNSRYFLPWQPIDVSPIGLNFFASKYGLQVLFSELVWIILPLAGSVLLARWLQKKARREGNTDEGNTDEQNTGGR